MASRFQNKLIAEGYCDTRGAAFCATVTQSPVGYGIVLLCVDGNILNLYNVDIASNVKQLLYKIELCKIKNLKIRSGFFMQLLRFEYAGHVFSFTNFVGVKPALRVIEQEADRDDIRTL